ncbi:MAG TPA: lipase family protein [Smithella sp.]|nr:lipase family protein [Smithella sp.]HOG89599.1 lipase family protein [Smithella sp.]
MKRLALIKKFFLLGLSVIFLFACSQGGDSSSASDHNASPDNSNVYLVESTSLGKVSADSIRKTALDAGLPVQAIAFMKHSIKLFKITYRTTYKGQSILASALITYPIAVPDPMPSMIVGNIQTFADRYAPSEFNLSDISTSFAAIAALAGSAGYYTLVPDMIGSGVSKDIIYPMRNSEHAAKTMIDLIRAGDEFIKAKKIKVNGKKFIAGYSEGGYIAMATLKMIEERPIEGINITATAVGAGGYNLVRLLNKAIMEGDGTYPSPCFPVSLIYSYNVFYEWGRPLSDFFQEPYAGRIPDLLSGQFTSDEIDAQLTYSLNSLLNPVFVDNLKNNNEPALINALSENSVDNWTPQGKLMIFHNVNDPLIPFSDSLATYNTMLSNGAQNLIFKDTDKIESHRDSATEFLIMASLWFESMNQ